MLNLDEIAPGLFWVVSKNHGGMLAAVDDLITNYDVGEGAVRAAEAFGLIRSHAGGDQSVRIWRSEEGVDWRTTVCASPAVHAAWVESYRRPGALPPSYPFEMWAREHAAVEKLQDQLRFWRPTYPQTIPLSPLRPIPAATAQAPPLVSTTADASSLGTAAATPGRAGE